MLARITPVLVCLVAALLLAGCDKPTAPAPDVAPPVVQISSPVADASLDSLTVMLTGTLSDSVAVNRATYAINQGVEQELAITPGAAASFSTRITLQPGLNAVTVHAYDAAGNKGVATVGGVMVDTVPRLAAANATVISTGGRQACALGVDGGVYCWGYYLPRDVPPRPTTPPTTPVRAAAPGVFTSVSVGSEHRCALAADGQVFCWGYNEQGQLGTSTKDTVLHPNPVPVASSERFAALSAGSFHTCALTREGQAFCWGRNNTRTGTGITVPTPVPGGLSFRSIDAGETFTCGVTPANSAYCWGSNTVGRLGDGTRTDRDDPTPVAGGLTFRTVSAGAGHACGIVASGAAYCWGANGTGQLGNGNVGAPSETPVPVSGGLVFERLSAGAFSTCGVTRSGAAYCWGYDTRGELGVGAAAPMVCTRSSNVRPTYTAPAPCSPTPLPVAGNHSFADLSAGGVATCGIDAKGAPYCWGTWYSLGTSAARETCTGQYDVQFACSRIPLPVEGGIRFASGRSR